MYKVELTEKEAKDLGEKRWLEKNKWRFLLAMLIPVGAAVLFAFISAPNALNISDWVSGPVVVGILMFAVFILWRGSRSCTKAGKEFVRTLKEA